MAIKTTIQNLGLINIEELSNKIKELEEYHDEPEVSQLKVLKEIQQMLLPAEKLARIAYKAGEEYAEDKYSYKPKWTPLTEGDFLTVEIDLT